MDGFRERFERVLKLRGYWLNGAPRPNAGKFCDDSKFQRHLLYGWLEGQVPTKYAEALAEFLKVKRRWLTDGEGDSGDPALDSAPAQPLQLPTTTTVTRSASTERRLADQDLKKCWAQVHLAFNTRKVNPDRWDRVKKALNDLVTDSPQERAAVSTRNRNRP